MCTLAGFTTPEARTAFLIARCSPSIHVRVERRHHASTDAFEQPEAPAVRQGGHQPYGSLELREQMLDLSASQYDRQVLWPLWALDALDPRQTLFQYFAIQERMAFSA